MTIVTSFVLAILLWAIMGFRSGTHPLIYVTAGLLFGMGCWHIQTLWRTILLRKHIKASKPVRDEVDAGGPITDKQLVEANFEGYVPASVTDRTTTLLKNSRK